MTATLPAGMEYKLLGTVANWVPTEYQTKSLGIDAPGVWGSEHPDEEGVRTQIVAVTGVRDQVGDIIVPGAFRDTLAELEPKVVLGHDWNRPVGMPEAIEELLPGDPRLPRTDRFGRPWPVKAGALFARTRYLLGTKDGRDAYEHAKFFGPKLANSIGYVPLDEHTWHDADPDTGEPTRFLGKIKLFEYGPVLHGAHPLAGGLPAKSGKPGRMRHKRAARPSMEFKIRLVRDSSYWGLPLGTPIRPGMKPRGPKAQRIQSAGQQPREDVGAVEIDANAGLTIKPTAKRKLKGPAAIDAALSGVLDLSDSDPFDSDSFVTEDRENLNKGEEFNPLDVLVANALTPAEVEDALRNSDWNTGRLGDQDQVMADAEGFIRDVVDAYREKYNAELVRQNDSGTDDVPDPDAPPVAGTPDAPDAEIGPDAPDVSPRPTEGSTDLAAIRQAIEAAPDDPAVARARGKRDRATTAIQLVARELGVPGDALLPVIKADIDMARTLGEDLADLLDEDPDGDRKVNERAIDADEIADQIERSGANLGKASDLPAKLRAHAQGLRAASDILIGRSQERDEAADTQRRGEAAAERDRQGAEAVAGTGAEAPPGEPAAPQTPSGNTAAVSNLAQIPQDQFDAMLQESRVNLGKVRDLIRNRERSGARVSPAVRQAYDQAEAHNNALEAENARRTDTNTERQGRYDALPEEGQDAYAAARESGQDPDAAIGTAEGGATEAATIAMEDGRTLARVEPETGEAQAYEITDDAGRRLRVFELSRPRDTAKPWAFDIIEPDGTRTQGADTYSSPGSALVQAEGEFGAAPGAPQAQDDPEFWDDLAYAVQDALDPTRATSDTALADALNTAGVPDAETRADELREQYDGGDPTGAVDRALGLLDEQRGTAGPEGAGQVADPAQAEAEARAEQTERIAAEELAEAEEAADAGFGIIEAPDGELEAEPDVADRQDRVGSLLDRADAGALDLSADAVSDDGLRSTRSDLVEEIRLQTHIERRRRGDRPQTPAEQERDATTGETDDAARDTADPVAEPEDTGPKPRPGVAGAAEDLADALDEGDPDRIAAARARLAVSLARSRADSDQVAALRELLESGDPSADDLRNAAEAIRTEQRERRNAAARNRRRVRRFERERLRALLGQVEAEMRNRNLDYDPLPDPDGDAETTEVIPVTPGGWETGEPDSFTGVRSLTLDGAGYTATVTPPPGDGRDPVRFSWTVRDDEGNSLAGGHGHAPDVEAGRAAVELALEVQRNVGRLPADSLPPTASLPLTSSATPPQDVLTSVATMRRRVTEGRAVNPLTGVPDPLSGDGPTLAPLTARVFDGIEQARTHLEARVAANPKLSGNLGAIRWDTAKLSPGGAFFTAENSNERGTQLYHAASGLLYSWGQHAGVLGAVTDLQAFAAIVERLPDEKGHLVDWSRTTSDELRPTIEQWTRDSDNGMSALNEAAVQALTAQKVREGKWTHKLIGRASQSPAAQSAVTNPTRLEKARELDRSLAQIVNVRRGSPSPEQRKVLEVAAGAAALEKLGAPDAAAVLLRRHAAELREKHGGDADVLGAPLLDGIAEAYLSAYSPVRSPGERVASLRAGERVHTTDHDNNARTFRVLAEPRRKGGYYNSSTYPVVEEGTGRQLYLQVDDREVRLTESADQHFGSEYHSYRNAPTFVVLDRDEEPPADLDELRAITRGESGAIPAEVLDSAAEALPESGREAATRRATPNPTGGTRPPRRRSAAAPRRTAPEPTALPPAEEENLAIAQARALDTFYGGVAVGRGEPAPGGFASLDEVAEHLREVLADDDPERARTRGSAQFMLDEITAGRIALSPGGHLLVQRDGTVAHAGTGMKIWPAGGAAEEVTAAGFAVTPGIGPVMAATLETLTFDGEVLSWDKDPRKAVSGMRATQRRIGGADPLVIATRAGYLDGVMGQKNIKGKDALMLRNMARAAVPADQLANPEALSEGQPYIASSVYGTASGVRQRGDEDRFLSTTKAGATLARRVNLELTLADMVHHAAPLDVVRRLTALADELDGKTIETADQRGGSKTLVPSDDIRKVVRAIVNANDETRPSTAARLRRSGYRGLVRAEGDVEVHVGTGWHATGGTRTEEMLNEVRDAVRDGDGIRFYTDEKGHRHATFLDFDLVHKDTKYKDPNMLGDHVPGRPTDAWITVADDGRLTLEFKRERRHLVVSLPPGSWSFEPDTAREGDSE